MAYSFSETLDFRKGAGPFDVHGAVYKFETASAVSAVLSEMHRLGGEELVSEESLTYLQEAKLPRWIDRFETLGDVVSQLAYMEARAMPDHTVEGEWHAYQAVTKRKWTG